MAKNLKNLCFDVLYGEEQRVQSTLYHLMKVFKLWNLPNFIQRYKNDNIKWNILIQDVNNPDSVTLLTLSLESPEEFERFEAFLRHLNSNWFQDIKVQKLYSGSLSFLVTNPAPVLLHIIPQNPASLDEHSSFSTSKSSNVETVSKIISLLVKDLCLCILNEPENLSRDAGKKRQTKETTRSESPDEYPVLQTSGNDILATDSYYHNTPDVLQDQCKQAYISASNLNGSQNPQSQFQENWLASTESLDSRVLSDQTTEMRHKQVENRRHGQESLNETASLTDMLHTAEVLQKSGNDTLATDSCNHNTPSDVLLQQLTQPYIPASNDSQNSQSLFEENCLASDSYSYQSAQKQSSEVGGLEEEKVKLKRIIETLSHEIKTKTTLSQLQINELREENKKIALTLAKKEAEIEETFLELGRLSVELMRVRNEKKKDELFNKMYKLRSASTQTSGISEWSTTSLDLRVPVLSDQTTEVGHNQVENCHGQESLNETTSLTDIPHTAVDGNIYNNYKLLLLRISQDILPEDVLELKQWVETEFEIDTSESVNKIFQELDRKKIITITDLSRLKKFFERNWRYEIVNLINNYLRGKYSELKIPKPNERSFSRGGNVQNGLFSQQFGHLQLAQWPSRSTTREHSAGAADQSRGIAPGFERQCHGLQTNSREIGDTAGVSSSTQHTTDAKNGSGFGTDVGKWEDAEVQSSGSTVRGDQVNTSRNSNPGSNGQKLSKFQPPDTDDDDDNWLCSHYKRRCYVKFECCNNSWPCHRCHNNQSTCGRRKLKSCDTKQLKCVACSQEQPFAHYCSRCNAKFARYFCGLCKHLTGTDDNPYHCEKCDICRLHRDRSFHCDVCGVCKDVQLRGNHKCRAGSSHDKCCICLEDAFTGCQILPCSHRVHKECATQMIRSGMKCCPICRESFAHKIGKKTDNSLKG